MNKKMPIIRGFNKLAESGVHPDKTKIYGPAIFLGGCNLKCPYCMNSRLVNAPKEVSEVDIGVVKAYVIENKPEMLTISGGEPTCTKVDLLKNLIAEIKSWGIEVGMSTNGTNPDILKKVIRNLAYVSLDLKVIPEKFNLVGNLDSDNQWIPCLQTMVSEKEKRKDFSYEIRTTLYPPFVRKEDISFLASCMPSNSMWILQQFRRAKNMLSSEANDVQYYSDKEIKEIVRTARKYITNTYIRFV